ncbi:hypothetical protein Tco_1384473 [Tanacetum coccineum]
MAYPFPWRSQTALVTPLLVNSFEAMGPRAKPRGHLPAVHNSETFTTTHRLELFRNRFSWIIVASDSWYTSEKMKNAKRFNLEDALMGFHGWHENWIWITVVGDSMSNQLIGWGCHVNEAHASKYNEDNAKLSYIPTSVQRDLYNALCTMVVRQRPFH